MVRTTRTKARISLNSRKQVSLFVGNTTPVNLIPYLGLEEYTPEHFNHFSFSDDSDVSEHIFFTPTNGKERKHYAPYEEALQNFVAECIKALEENTPTTAKELFNLTSYVEQEESASMTFGEWLQRVIDLYRYNNPHANKKAQTWATYDVVRRKCEIWNNGEVLRKNVCDVTNADFEAFGKWIETELEGRNYKNLMKNFASTMNQAIKASKETGCTKEHNKLDYSLATKKVRKTINGKPIEATEKVCFTTAQIQTIKALNIDDLQIQDRNKCIMSAEKKQMYLDIIKFALHTGMRPIDLLRLEKNSIIPYFGKNCVVYLPIKFDYVKNDSPDDVPKRKAAIQVYGDMQSIIDKYSAMSDSKFVFPIEANTKYNGRYEEKRDYARYNHTEAQINLVLKAVAKNVGVTGKVTLYTCRHSVATMLANNSMPISALARQLGTSERMLHDVYIHGGIDDYSAIFNNLCV